ncbi:MAG: signal peptidase II [Neptuniibacter caesariensis]|uniref:Lipoprotein signal peptidase n=1 Tax=Neptuniibacter caesariensis TaxID=207954 RepID=A0A2G6JAU4_NEPCE|nr:MAG: signal peptidase II [Neptuniibacter caesariensis]
MAEEQQKKTSESSGSLIWLRLALAVVIVDLGTKYLADTFLVYADPNPILPFFDLTLLYNKGAAFSFLADAGGWQRWFFVAIAAVVSVVLVVWLQRTQRKVWWLGLGLSLILGGALGNLYDRAVMGYVVDFLSFHYGNYFFPAFNLADSAITVGATIMLLDMLFLEGKRRAADEKALEEKK